MKKNLLAAGLVALIFSSCNTKSEEKYVPKDGTTTSTPAPVITNPESTTAQQVNPATQNQPMQVTTQQAVPLQMQSGVNQSSNATKVNQLPNGATMTTSPAVTQTPAQTTTTATAPGMNPPHGQPGHRCDINVGAPLNSKPQAVVPPVVTQQQPVQASMTQQPAAATKTAPGMNPPHGEPGHRCEISVGAPLNSKPAKKDSGN